MIRSKLAGLAAIGVAAMAVSIMVGDDARAYQSSDTLDVNEAVQCIAQSSRIGGHQSATSRWSSAVESWRSYGVYSDQEESRFKSMVAAMNRSNAGINSVIRQYNRECEGVRMTRSMHQQLCTGVNNNFCRSFDF
ncbi:hypothetical protein [Alteriqipengyuania sp.]|uniref:hypothetical protein n=1 Tax=Alteriqipengyuania sp. TaxID=2800692 RepID=UPI0035140368